MADGISRNNHSTKNVTYILSYVCASSLSGWPFLHLLLAGVLENLPQLALLGTEVIGKGYLGMMDIY